MIVKKMKRTNFSMSKAVMISELVDYIFATHDDHGKEKLAHFGSLNFLTTTRVAQKNEMIALAEESIQSKMPVAHWVLSWKDGEQPTPEKVDFAVQYFLQLMEWKEHQTFYAVHKNTSNLHVHILVNRVHPNTLKVHRPNEVSTLTAPTSPSPSSKESKDGRAKRTVLTNRLCPGIFSR